MGRDKFDEFRSGGMEVCSARGEDVIFQRGSGKVGEGQVDLLVWTLVHEPKLCSSGYRGIFWREMGLLVEKWRSRCLSAACGQNEVSRGIVYTHSSIGGIAGIVSLMAVTE